MGRAMTFFDVLPEVLDACPPLPGEEALYALVRSVLAASAADRVLHKALAEAAAEADAAVGSLCSSSAISASRSAYNWTTVINSASSAPTITRAPPSPGRTPSSTARARRAISTRISTPRARGSQARRDTPSPSTNLRRSRASGRSPSTTSITSSRPNALERFSLGTRSKQLRFEADGSLVIYVQSDRPSEDRLANWLPSPQGPFSLYLRAYWPLPAIQEGRWTPPPVVPA